MAIAPYIVALGDAPSVSLPAAATVAIAPPDDSVDTNRVIITGSGTINSFGIACGALTRAQYLNDPGDVAATNDVMTVTKRVEFNPDAGQTITLHHDPLSISLLGGVDRTIGTHSFGEYQSDSSGYWCETQFSQGDIKPTQDGTLISFITYVASQPITIPANCTKAWVRMWGGAGAPGASGEAVGGAPSPGVGAPGYLEKYLTGLAAGKTLAFTLGAAGAPDTYPGAKGGDGSASILASGTQTIATLTANGSIGSTTNGTAGSAGGTATGGDVNRTGQTGGFAYKYSPDGTTFTVLPGVGGQTALARGPDGSHSNPGPAGIPGGLIIAWFR
jgi:hypothetical protein